jgi:aminoglycoside phosphotransferase (APT) family kinase protein
MDRVIEWLAKNLPPSPAPTLVHNDYKLDNVMLRTPNFDRIEAVLDWEMATVGDPLSDLGLTLCYWAWPTAPEFRAMGLQAPSSLPGWYSRDQFVERYAEKTGRDISHMDFYLAFARLKVAVIVQQIYYRYHQGLTKDERFASMPAVIEVLLQTSLEGAETGVI